MKKVLLRAIPVIALLVFLAVITSFVVTGQSAELPSAEYASITSSVQGPRDELTAVTQSWQRRKSAPDPAQEAPLEAPLEDPLAGVPKAWEGDPIPKAWDDRALEDFSVPLAHPDANPITHVPAAKYYQVKVRKIFRSYPVYHPDHEPEGYLEQLAEQEAEIAFDPARLKTREDWLAAGEIAFEAPTSFDGLADVEKVRDPRWYEKTGMPVAGDGTVPMIRYVIREKGKVEVGEFSCATCHTRVMADGTVIKGAQGNYPLGRLSSVAMKDRVLFRLLSAFQGHRPRFRRPYAAPWVEADLMAPLEEMTYTDVASAFEIIPAGVQPRTGTGLFHPVQVPDLIGIGERRYFDRTGHRRHRDIGDLMRYSAIAQGMDNFKGYGSYQERRDIFDPKRTRRYSDEQLYAIALYVYSLKPPPNPHPFDERAARGREIFESEGCGGCHSPPLYTNNALTPVAGFEPPPDHPDNGHIVPYTVGTDATLSLRTRRGTGFYKVPSLQGVWYRGPLEHSGSVMALEDWFDPRRLEEDYVPTGYPGYGVATRAVPGHRFGLDLSEENRAALLAFLRTL